MFWERQSANHKLERNIMKKTIVYTFTKTALKAGPVTVARGWWRWARWGASNVQIAITPYADGGTESCNIYPAKEGTEVPAATGMGCVLFDNTNGRPVGEVFTTCKAEK
jgi:hypothetical protein